MAKRYMMIKLQSALGRESMDYWVRTKNESDTEIEKRGEYKMRSRERSRSSWFK